MITKVVSGVPIGKKDRPRREEPRGANAELRAEDEKLSSCDLPGGDGNDVNIRTIDLRGVQVPE